MKIHIKNQQTKADINKRFLRSKVIKLMKLTGCDTKEISITFVNDESIRRINQEYLHKDKTTNVISFSLLEGEFGNINPNIMGDIIISVDTAQRDAAKGSLSLDEELLFLIIHGLLHLLGYDHEKTTKENASIMYKKQKDLFQILTTSD